ncbi:hypothetical protein ACLOJK_003055 [Asimina triloba]
MAFFCRFSLSVISYEFAAPRRFLSRYAHGVQNPDRTCIYFLDFSVYFVFVGILEMVIAAAAALEVDSLRMASSSNSPCAACKFLRRKCMNECVFAPYFPPDQPQKFANVHKVFGASNVAKLLNDIIPAQREDAVNSLAYEAEARLRDPVYGCVGLISILQNKLRQVQLDLYNAKKELASYIGPSAMMPIAHPAAAIMPQPHQSTGVTNAAASMVVPYGVSAMGHGIPAGPQPHAAAAAHALMREQHQQQQQHMMETHQLAAAVREQELMRSYEHQQELARYNSGFDASSAVGPAAGFNQMTGRAGSPSPLALVSFDNSFTAQQEQEHPQHPYQQQQQPPPQQQQQQRAGSEDGLSSTINLSRLFFPLPSSVVGSLLYRSHSTCIAPYLPACFVAVHLDGLGPTHEEERSRLFVLLLWWGGVSTRVEPFWFCGDDPIALVENLCRHPWPLVVGWGKRRVIGGGGSHGFPQECCVLSGFLLSNADCGSAWIWIICTKRGLRVLKVTCTIRCWESLSGQTCQSDTCAVDRRDLSSLAGCDVILNAPINQLLGLSIVLR